MAWIVSLASSLAGELYVSTNIQAAIDGAAPGDLIHLASGKYPETLVINKSLSLIGTGTNCVVCSCQTNWTPLITIIGPAVVNLSNFEVVGGQYQSWNDWYNGFSPRGIAATNATVSLNSMVINQFLNYFVSVEGGSLAATNVALWTVDINMGGDVGFELDNCAAVLDGLTQDAGRLDHTVNINMLSTLFSEVRLINSRVRASRLTWGNCVRTYCDSRLVVSNCYFYRGNAPDEKFVPLALSQSHNGVGLNGYSNQVFLTANTISNLPWAVFCYASFGGVQLLMESNSIWNSTYGGVFLNDFSYRAADLGGGALGSRGGNSFYQTPGRATNYWGDVVYTNNAILPPAANLFALHNSWSNPTNRESVIWDKLDNPDDGRLLTEDLVLQPAGWTASGQPVLAWNERGAGEFYTVETCSSLTSRNWTKAPGSWPVQNSGLNPMRWTNPGVASTNLFFRLRSGVP